MSFTKIQNEWSKRLDNGLLLRATDDPQSSLLEHFFAGYDRAFVLPDEREELDGFRLCLEMNTADIERFGRFSREFILVIENETGTVIGGSNFLMTRIDNVPAGYPEIAIAFNYAFVEKVSRGNGIVQIMKDEIGLLANSIAGLPESSRAPLIFFEQNHPLKMSEEDYVFDTAHSGLDQIDRLKISAKMGGLFVDFPYVQPALSADKESDDGLLYLVFNAPSDVLDPVFFRKHLESFFGISVMKGGDPSSEVTASEQLSLLDEMAVTGRSIALVPMLPVIEKFRAQRASAFKA